MITSIQNAQIMVVMNDDKRIKKYKEHHSIDIDQSIIVFLSDKTGESRAEILNNDFYLCEDLRGVASIIITHKGTFGMENFDPNKKNIHIVLDNI